MILLEHNIQFLFQTSRDLLNFFNQSVAKGRSIYSMPISNSIEFVQKLLPPGTCFDFNIKNHIISFFVPTSVLLTESNDDLLLVELLDCKITMTESSNSIMIIEPVSFTVSTIQDKEIKFKIPAKLCLDLSQQLEKDVVTFQEKIVPAFNSKLIVSVSSQNVSPSNTSLKRKLTEDQEQDEVSQVLNSLPVEVPKKKKMKKQPIPQFLTRKQSRLSLSQDYSQIEFSSKREVRGSTRNQTMSQQRLKSVDSTTKVKKNLPPTQIRETQNVEVPETQVSTIFSLDCASLDGDDRETIQSAIEYVSRLMEEDPELTLEDTRFEPESQMSSTRTQSPVLASSSLQPVIVTSNDVTMADKETRSKQKFDENNVTKGYNSLVAPLQKQLNELQNSVDEMKENLHTVPSLGLKYNQLKEALEEEKRKHLGLLQKTQASEKEIKRLQDVTAESEKKLLQALKTDKFKADLDKTNEVFSSV